MTETGTDTKKERIPMNYFVTETGIFYEDEPDSDRAPMWISDKLTVIADTRDENGQNWGKLVEFTDKDGRKKKMTIARAAMAGDCREVREMLMDAGLNIATGQRQRNRFADYINLCNPGKFALCTHRTGWYKDAFIFPDTIISNNTDEQLYFQKVHRQKNKYTTAGTIEQWRDNIGALCRGNSRLIFAVSVAFASMICNKCHIENAGFHIVGASSCGKSTLLNVAASIFGAPDYVNTWRATDNGLEGIAQLHNDTLLILDELGQVDAKKAGDISYMLSNGTGKTRANRSGYANDCGRWHLFTLSSGEIDLETHMQTAGQRIKAGQDVRMITIPAVPEQSKYKTFEDIHDQPDGGTFAKTIKELAGEYYGTPAREFIRAIINDDTPVYKMYAEYAKTFSSVALSANAGEQERRVCDKFALIAFAGEYATSKGLTGWNPAEAQENILKCFRDFVSYRGGIGNKEEKAIIEQVRYFLESNGESRFYNLNSAKEQTPVYMAGYKRTEDEQTYFYITPEVLKTDILKGYNVNQALQILFDAGYLMSLKSESNRFCGKVTRTYKISNGIME